MAQAVKYNCINQHIHKQTKAVIITKSPLVNFQGLTSSKPPCWLGTLDLTNKASINSIKQGIQLCLILIKNL